MLYFDEFINEVYTGRFHRPRHNLEHVESTGDTYIDTGASYSYEGNGWEPAYINWVRGDGQWTDIGWKPSYKATWRIPPDKLYKVEFSEFREPKRAEVLGLF